MHQLYCCITRVYRWSVAKRCIKRLCVGVEEVLDIGETLHLEFLWFLLDHLPVKHTHTHTHKYTTETTMVKSQCLLHLLAHCHITVES